jgi:ribulose-phosphate 3-epimerase
MKSRQGQSDPAVYLPSPLFLTKKVCLSRDNLVPTHIRIFRFSLTNTFIKNTQKTRSFRATTSLNVWGDKDFLIAPSILSADFARLGEEVDNVLAAGADVVHFDVMDNHYVPNLTIGPMVCKALRDHGVTAPIDVHLMVSPVDAIIKDFADAGASYITFHPEATNHVDRSLQLIKSLGCKAGLVFNPATSLDAAKYVTDKLDLILLMSVNPGFGGQAFIPATLEKARAARKLIDDAGIDCRLEIDGGVKVDNIKEVAEAGVDMMVAGSAILKEPRTMEAYKKTIDQMRSELAKVNKKEPVAA